MEDINVSIVNILYNNYINIYTCRTSSNLVPNGEIVESPLCLSGLLQPAAVITMEVIILPIPYSYKFIPGIITGLITGIGSVSIYQKIILFKYT